jgi:hypothetical protein
MTTAPIRPSLGKIFFDLPPTTMDDDDDDDLLAGQFTSRWHQADDDFYSSESVHGSDNVGDDVSATASDEGRRCATLVFVHFCCCFRCRRNCK